MVTSQFLGLRDRRTAKLLSDAVSVAREKKMRTHAAIVHHHKADLESFLIILVLGLPALFAFLGAAGLAHDAPYLRSGLWFFYLVSRNLGFIGVIVAAVMTGRAMFQRTVSDAVLGLMAASIVTAIALLWSAVHTLPNLW